MVEAKDPIELHGNNSAGEVISYTVSSSADIPVNTLLQMTDPRTASASSAAGEIFAGVASMEKTSADDSETMSAYTKGVFPLYLSDVGGCVIGDQLVLAGANMVKVDNTEIQEGKIVGTAFADGAAETYVSCRINK